MTENITKYFLEDQFLLVINRVAMSSTVIFSLFRTFRATWDLCCS